MSRKYFGTDGIRGQANSPPMTPDMALKVAMATARVLRREHDGRHKSRALIGKDTRLSGYMVEQAMASGFVAMGMDVVLVGPIPTPAVAMLTRTLRADVGVMISASHNPYQDNGIKLFAPDGFKLADETEDAIETWIDASGLGDHLAAPDALGRASRLEDAAGRYIESVKTSFPKGRTLGGLRVVVDCANGAAYKVAPQILWELEAGVIAMADRPDGRNINAGCGATDIAALQARVVAEGADIGLALDGDADRLIVVDETGEKIDGDQIMALLATAMKAQGALSKDAVVATVMSNLGLERYLEANGIRLVRTPVGDRHVVEAMRAGGHNLGGEQSGHIILGDHATTGDGLLAALQVLAVLQESGKPASALMRLFAPLPQLLRNVRVASRDVMNGEPFRAALKAADGRLSGSGRVLVRPSGTEPVIRVMAEGDDPELVESVVSDLCGVISAAS